MRILITASRDHHPDIVAMRIEQWVEQNVPQGERITIIHGDAPGGDQGARWIADVKGWNAWAYPAEWDRLGKAAGAMRNLEMISEAKPDVVLGFPLPNVYGPSGHLVKVRSKGTLGMLKLARRLGIRAVEWNVPPMGIPEMHETLWHQMTDPEETEGWKDHK